MTPKINYVLILFQFCLSQAQRSLDFSSAKVLLTWLSKVNTQAKGKYSLTLDNFSLSSQQLVLSYILYPCKCPEVHITGILAQV